ncbi:MarR family winged helix-turn-helix transcriptional regulator [Paenibacillus flagellatus]|uniref:MarR family transcriptional regulator n=1 Tax=Paenibacillus flagellatus TaxID=2211139 RepID=A0A2V5K3I1_9BACL|nr:MarR family transcriptional regulator [Paenibacillus flagellatus]PYI53751.1 MarR family transcriptional regulator [Paenibacillus flagellatus]
MGADKGGNVERFHAAIEFLKRKLSTEFFQHLKFGLTGPQFYMLYMIREKGPSKVTALADQMEVKPSAITVMIDRLVAQGFVAREHDAKDRRVVLVQLTSQGQEVLKQLEQKRKEIVGRYFDRLEPEEVDELIRILEKMGSE